MESSDAMKKVVGRGVGRAVGTVQGNGEPGVGEEGFVEQKEIWVVVQRLLTDRKMFECV